MDSDLKNRTKGIGNNIRIKCRVVPTTVEALSDFMDVIAAIEKPERTWYRGHSASDWLLKPKAYRYETPEKCRKANDLLKDFRRFAVTKLDKPPDRTDRIEWLGIAQHYGLPTRLLDWTTNPAIALYFACLSEMETHASNGKVEKIEKDGAVYIFKPADVNWKASEQIGQPARGEAYDTEIAQDREIIDKYVSANGVEGCIAINPAYNSTRILQQKGTFTLHADNKGITQETAPSLTAVPILAEYKERIRLQLATIGVEEMSIFPELEHICAHLERQV